MPLSLRPTLPSAPAALRVIAVLALATGLGVWASILLAPRPGPLPPAVSAAAPRAADNTPVALWFGKDEVMRTQISVLGVIAAGPDGAAVLSVDGGPPLAWRAGGEVAPGIVLRDIAADAVTVEQAGRMSRLATPAAEAAPPGIAQVK
ncbi:general secretion pathway protein GspC [Achromobacter deleyi]|uniref:general secretion pathway protein GspC n=1 Tax=Achromobacter deleyi TaxID=1353891 RepID=UPI001492F9E7|nr:general secretion pathway protein GspC [Achromobacter deleyi]QVQ28821.1 general secretion pathway protein GspC [Achromobacter deleyi]UIP18937.1 general secretion pathway protein GspC [Achromobacter deleyi]